MSITLDLPPKIEALLRQRAQSTGQDISQMAIAVLTLGLSLDDSDFFEALKGIQRGLDDFERGQFSSLEDFIAEQNQKYGLSLEAWPENETQAPGFRHGDKSVATSVALKRLDGFSHSGIIEQQIVSKNNHLRVDSS